MSGKEDPKSSRSPKNPLPPSHQFYEIDEFTEHGIKASKARLDSILKYHWDFYCDLALKRAKVLPSIKSALAEAALSNFRFSKWKRMVQFRHSMAPLSSRGSLICDPGGRFNIGDIDTTRFPPFPALYLASDMKTCTHEAFGIPFGSELTVYDHALVKEASISYVSISGQIDNVIDLINEPEKLKPFLDIIKKFDIPNHLYVTARKLNIPEPVLITTVKQLVTALLAHDWRNSPMQLDIPAAPQIFAQVVLEAGIGGIYYPSQYTNSPCLAIFPQNFETSDSFVQLEETNLSDFIVRRMDASNWHKLC